MPASAGLITTANRPNGAQPGKLRQSNWATAVGFQDDGENYPFFILYKDTFCMYIARLQEAAADVSNQSGFDAMQINFTSAFNNGRIQDDN